MMRAALVSGVLALCACESFGDAHPSASDSDASTPDASTPDGAADAAASDGAPPDAGATADPTLLAHWKMDESSGPTVTDSIGGRDGLTIGGGKFVPGKIGNAFSTEGGSAHVLVGNAGALAVTKQFTIAMWLSLSTSQSDSFFYTHGYQFSMKLNVRRPQLYVGSNFYVNVPYSLPPDEWHHVAATFDSGVVKIYVDGADAGEDERGGSETTAPAMTGAIKIGTSNGETSSARGAIDDVRLWRRVLAPAEIKDLAADLE